MKESLLIKICLISVISGIILMFLSTIFFKPKDFKIKDINEKINYVKITGKIVQKSVSKSGTIFLKIQDDTGTIDIVVFKDSIKNIDEVKSGQEVEVTGKPEKYKEKMEIIASSIQ